MSGPKQHHGHSEIHDSYFPKAYSSSYQSQAPDSTPPRPARPTFKYTPTSASYASPSSAASTRATASIAPLSRTHSSLGKRTRPMSPSFAPPSYAVSPFTPSGAPPTPDVWSHINAANGAGSPPPMTSTRYVLAGGMDTPSILAEKRYGEAEGMFDLAVDGRMGRDWRLQRSRTDEMLGLSGVVGGERNGRSRRDDVNSDEQRNQLGDMEQQNSWGGAVLGALGSVVAGAVAFCRKAAFNGFYAGGGQGYNLVPPDDTLASESMWEDVTTPHQSFLSNSTRSYDRLSTPVPGEYPPDSPPEDNVETEREEEPRPAKRRQTHSGGGGWIVVDRREARSRTRSPRLTNSAPVGSNRVSQHQRGRSGGSQKRPILPATSRSRQRLAGAAITTTATTTGSPQVMHSNPAMVAIAHHQRSPSRTGAQKSSPPSVEVQRLVAKKRREERMNEERYDRVNDRLKEMIKQGKEALGAKVEIVEGDDVW